MKNREQRVERGTLRIEGKGKASVLERDVTGASTRFVRLVGMRNVCGLNVVSAELSRGRVPSDQPLVPSDVDAPGTEPDSAN
uniref:Uncharacterized protein n=1 Tax=Vespula pensylvanica TaxID=30213 RepID=A0A834JVK4_VESPE|nr:hypothetical protein H0235_017016 [Vespula pensylvanica]